MPGDHAPVVRRAPAWPLIAALALVLPWAPRVQAQPAPEAEPAPPPAPAEPEAPSPTDRADLLKAEGDRAMQELRFTDALARYEEAHAIAPSPALLYNRGRAYEKLGRFPDALAMMRAFEAEAPEELRKRVPNLGVLIADLERRTTVLTVRTTPAGARVRLGDVVLGTTPLVERRVNASPGAELRLELEGHFQHVRNLKLPGGQVVELALELAPRDGRGLLVIDSPVRGAYVEIDGRAVGQVPTESWVTPGEHQIGLRADGYEDNLVEVVLRPGETKRVVIEPGESPIHERWWFWTAGGALVLGAGATALGIALTTEGSPDAGSIAPGTVAVAGRAHRAPSGSEVRLVLPVVDLSF